ncbi:MAG: hypothetical protein K5905_25775 [Roseibium sp.]|uniref:hypothetical protein n=1 Tax=Roseibium sp. TaxID=1936156 RepID=UPI0026068095|nr:hypothetical protein [Roseibium sp.]MCV0428879.1 hypothetical protein [Roseibium sp.]
MSTNSNNDKPVKPKRESAESKAETTKRVSQELVQAEADRRAAKTAKLRAARLEMQARQSAAETVATKPKKKTRTKS